MHLKLWLRPCNGTTFQLEHFLGEGKGVDVSYKFITGGGVKVGLICFILTKIN